MEHVVEALVPIQGQIHLTKRIDLRAVKHLMSRDNTHDFHDPRWTPISCPVAITNVYAKRKSPDIILTRLRATHLKFRRLTVQGHLGVSSRRGVVFEGWVGAYSQTHRKALKVSDACAEGSKEKYLPGTTPERSVVTTYKVLIGQSDHFVPLQDTYRTSTSQPGRIR